LPLKENMLHSLPDYHIFYKPKDIVSGDFYGFTKKDGKLYSLWQIAQDMVCQALAENSNCALKSLRVLPKDNL
jgi:serine phosphatase RsbU (regulator of sigma subunit)